MDLLAKLEWPLLLDKITEYCQTDTGKEKILQLRPNLARLEIEQRWQDIESLLRVIRLGYVPPIGEIEPVEALLKAARLNQVLTGIELRAVFLLLDSSRKVGRFANDFASRSEYLQKLATVLKPLPELLRQIEKAVDEEGELRDDASDELTRIRKQKRGLASRIEQKLKQFLRENDVEKYIQEDFYTIRADRYVVPISLDGRGRVAGSILDTSSSGQTLFIEPTIINPMNDALRELELEEKLEIIRIFRELSEKVKKEALTLSDNFNALSHLDFISSLAQFAHKTSAGPVVIVDEPQLDLRQARHPLLSMSESAVASNIQLSPNQKALIVSGPNAGGKTVVLKTVGLLHLMAKAGMLITADPNSKIYLYSELHIEMGDAQSLVANLSTFSGHIRGLLPIIKSAQKNHLVLLDELAVGTEPQTGAALAQAILERLVEAKATVVVTTHYDHLKVLAVHDPRFRNGSMEYSLATFHPTYKLILDVPGQSYGLEVAKENGFDEQLIERAKALRGVSMTALDSAVNELMVARDDARKESERMKDEAYQAQAAKARWEQEIALFEKTKKDAILKLKEKYETRFSEIKEKFNRLEEETRQKLKKLSSESSVWDAKNLVGEQKNELRGSLSLMSQLLNEMEGDGTKKPGSLPGREFSPSELKVGDRVYSIKIAKEGYVTKIAEGGELVEVQIGMISTKVKSSELRLLPERKKSAEIPSQSRNKKTAQSLSRPMLVIETATNTLDIRGANIDEGLAKMWRFIDSAMLRGEYGIIIVHGHGTDSLKQAVRQALQENSPYPLRFQPGPRERGGDGVTIVYFGD